MGFGRRKRTRLNYYQQLQLHSNNEMEKLKEISNQGLENTSQREEEKPSAKQQDNLRDAEHSSPPKLSKQEDKFLSQLEQGKSLTDKELNVIGNVQKKVNKAPTVNKAPVQKQKQINNVKQNIKKTEKKIEKLSSKGMRNKVMKEIALKEQQLKKLKNLLSRCPDCK